MIAVDDRKRWLGRTEFLTPTIRERAQGWKAQTSYQSEMALFSECMPLCAQNVLDTADIVRDGIFRQQTVVFSNTESRFECVSGFWRNHQVSGCSRCDVLEYVKAETLLQEMTQEPAYEHANGGRGGVRRERFFVPRPE